MTAVNVPLRQLPHQLPNMLAMATGGLRSYVPLLRGKPGREQSQTMAPPPEALLDAYLAWAGVDTARFGDRIPPHFAVSQMALAMISRLTAQAPYPLLSVLNQGVRLRMNAPLPRGSRITLRGQLADASDDGYRARIHSALRMGTAEQPEALLIDAFAAVPLKKRPGSKQKTAAEPDYRTIGHWQAAADEGVTFFKLTGDFNPIHTLPAVARRTRFGGCIMHGYGAFAQVFEAIRNSGEDIADIEVRFINALPLPSPQLAIQTAATADAEGRYALRLIDDAGTVYQVGSYIPAGGKA